MMADFQKFMEILREVYAHPSLPPFTQAYRQARFSAVKMDLQVPTLGQARRLFNKEAV